MEFAIRKMSFGRRIELARCIREIGQRLEFLEAGSDVKDRIDANILAREVDAIYLRWGLASIEGLTLDGEAPTAERLLECGPEALTSEILMRIKAECGLSDEERKN